MTASRITYTRYIEHDANKGWSYRIWHYTRQGVVIDAEQAGYATREEARRACKATEQAHGWTKVRDY